MLCESNSVRIIGVSAPLTPKQVDRVRGWLRAFMVRRMRKFGEDAETVKRWSGRWLCYMVAHFFGPRLVGRVIEAVRSGATRVPRLRRYPAPPTRGRRPCVNGARPGLEIVDCQNMREKHGDTDPEYEHYECRVCGKCDKLCYEDMK